MKPINNYKGLTNSKNNLPILGYSAIIGIAVGLLTCAYRFSLTYMEEFSIAIYGFLSEHMLFIPLAFIILSGMGYCVGILVTKYKIISGSGIPQIKGVLMGHLKSKWLSTIIAKFIGGSVSMLAGLSLGREGPSIQFGASIAQGIGNKLGKTRYEKRILIASGAGAGLAAAFNAPLSGVIFTLEEIFKYFSPLILLTTMVAAVISNSIARLIFGSSAIFNFTFTSEIPLSKYWLLILLGAVLGLFGAIYNKFLLISIRLFNKIKDSKYRIAIAFIIAGLFGLIFPVVLCGGHFMMNSLTIESSLGFLCIAFLMKFLFSMISYGSGAPGGIFFPLLVMGATIGAIFAKISISFFWLGPEFFANIIILAMAGFFTAIVRAPITGMVLLVEMTGSFSHLMPLSVVSLIAFVMADLLKSEPIYDSLLHNLLVAQKSELNEKDEVRKITIETIVQFDSPADKKYVRELHLPNNCLLISVKRHNREFIPHGDTQVSAGDYLVFLADLSDETKIRKAIDELTNHE
ncbi:MAG: ClC family H(+)/Cl(-) exchange transporter [Oscillospiraceae bacterium]|nr:ClC family H(+)/Cl(-) exchange transporter [Oscillospiraceae bacterium]